MTALSAKGPSNDEDPVVVGRIGKPFGVNGDVYVFADPDLGDPFDVGTTYGVQGNGEDGGKRRMTVVRSRQHGDRLVVGFEGSQDREGSQALRGLVLCRPRDQVRLDPDTIWVSELLGQSVVDPDGALVGTVGAIRDGYAHDYVVLQLTEGGQAIVPMVSELLDWTVDPLVLQPVEGLLDPDRAM